MTDTSTSFQSLSPSDGRTNETEQQLCSVEKRLDHLQNLVQNLPRQLATELSSSRPPSSARDGALHGQEDTGSRRADDDVQWITNLLVPLTSSVKKEIMAIRSDVQGIKAAQKAPAPRTPLPSSRPATSASGVAPEPAVIGNNANTHAAQAGQVQSHSVLPARPVEPRDATSSGQPSAQSGPKSPRSSRVENNVSGPERPKPSHPNTGPSCSEAGPRGKFRLGPEKMGVMMTDSIAELSNLSSFAYIIEVERLPISSDSDLQAIFTLETNPDLKVNKFAAIGHGYVRVTIDRAQESTAFKWPDFRQVAETPTEEEAVKAVEMFVRDPHKTAVHFGGTFGHQLVNKSQLHAGKALTGMKELTHVNEEYAHIGDKLTVTGMHREDANFRSGNIVDLGIKIWMLVKVEDNERFETAVEQQFGRKPCDQWLRHLCIFLAPSWFQEHQISYTLIIQRPGQMVVTGQGQYHQVLNYSACFARSINFLFAWEKMSSLESPGIAVCDECGLKNLRHFPQHHVRAVSPLPQSDDDVTTGPTAKKRKRVSVDNSVSFKRAKHTAASADAASSTRQSARIARKTGNTAAAVNGDSGVDVASDSDDDPEPTGRNGAGAEAAMPVPVDRLVVVPSPAAEEGVADIILRMAYAICSRDAVKQFAAAVNHWREPQLLAHCAPENDVPHDTSPETHGIIQTCKQLEKSVRRQGVETIFSRHAYVQFNRAYTLFKKGARRINSDVLKEVEAITKSTRKTLRGYIKQGTKWEKVCGPFDEGLLVFVLTDRVTLSPFGVTAQLYTDLSDEDRAQFYQLIQCSFVEKMCEAAKVWLEAVDGKRTIRFRWEDHDVNWDSLDEAGILSEMEFYDPEK
ncbi:hypothetical protein FDECE_9558 [Fusarium decemcellulare]|nr:hypothetical protein FDECE_9558 [Fusarium decemcellulare]